MRRTVEANTITASEERELAEPPENEPEEFLATEPGMPRKEREETTRLPE